MKTTLRIAAAAALVFAAGASYVQADNCKCTSTGCSGSEGWPTAQVVCNGTMYVKASSGRLGVAYSDKRWGHAFAQNFLGFEKLPCSVQNNSPNGSTVWNTDESCAWNATNVRYLMHN